MTTPEIKYTETYNENLTTITTGLDLIYRYPTAQSLSAVQADVRSWCQSHKKDFGNRPLSAVTISQDESSLGNIWTAHIEWSSKPANQQQQNAQYPQQPGVDPQESFNSIGGTAHIVTAFDEVGVLTDGITPAPPMYGGINWNGDRYEGVDIVSPTFEFTLSHKYPYDSVTSQVRNAWLSLIGCVNLDTFWACAPGEVLYCGFSGQSVTEYDGSLVEIDGQVYQAAKNYYQISHNFRANPNVASMTVAGVQISKLGWEYVWCLKSKYDDPTSGQTIEVPVAVYKDQVYRYANFSDAF